VSTWGEGGKFDAPHAKVSSNPALFIAEFGHEERQRLEMLKFSSTMGRRSNLCLQWTGFSPVLIIFKK
jgi:hypothetical protein